MSINNIISSNRKMQSLTQEELGNLLNISSKTISNWERGITIPDALIIPELCRALKISINQFYSLEEQDKLDVGAEHLKLEYELNLTESKFASFNKLFIISAILLFAPLISILGTIANNYSVFVILMILGFIALIYSIFLNHTTTLKSLKYIKNNNLDISYLDKIKKYNLSYYYLMFISLGLFITTLTNINNIIIFIALVVIIITIPLVIVDVMGYKYNIIQKLPYLIPTLISFGFGLYVFIKGTYFVLTFLFLLTALLLLVYYLSFLVLDRKSMRQ